MLTEAQAHRVFLHPSITASDGDTEGGAPVCITEMLAAGMPVVSTTRCDIPEVVGPALQHLVPPGRDAPAWVDRLKTLLAAHRDWPALAQAGRSRIESEYQRDLQAQRLRDLHLEVHCQPGRPRARAT